MAGELSEKAQRVIHLLDEKFMTRDQLGEHFKIDVDEVDRVIESKDEARLDLFLNLLEMMPGR